MQPTWTRRSWWMAAAVLLGWLGLFVHNLADLPGQTLLSPESLGPLIFSLALFACWVWWPRVGGWLLLGWAVLNVFGALLSVLPLPFLPFVPEQSVKHYAFHGLYLLAQVPLVIACLRSVRAR